MSPPHFVLPNLYQIAIKGLKRDDATSRLTSSLVSTMAREAPTGKDLETMRGILNSSIIHLSGWSMVMCYPGSWWLSSPEKVLLPSRRWTGGDYQVPTVGRGCLIVHQWRYPTETQLWAYVSSPEGDWCYYQRVLATGHRSGYKSIWCVRSPSAGK